MLLCPTLGGMTQMPSGMRCSPGSEALHFALGALRAFGWTKLDTRRIQNSYLEA